MIKKYFFILFIFSLSVIFVKTVQAGGCCYKEFSSTPGIANQEPAKVKATFVDPDLSYQNQGRGPTVLLKNKKVLVKIDNPTHNQWCKTLTETTNDKGTIEVECYSATPGTMGLYFEAPELTSKGQQSLSTIPRPVMFTGSITTAVTPIPSPMTTPSASPEATNQELADRINQLEEKVAAQEKEVTGLRAIINNIKQALSKFINL